MQLWEALSLLVRSGGYVTNRKGKLKITFDTESKKFKSNKKGLFRDRSMYSDGWFHRKGDEDHIRLHVPKELLQDNHSGKWKSDNQGIYKVLYLSESKEDYYIRRYETQQTEIIPKDKIENDDEVENPNVQ